MPAKRILFTTDLSHPSDAGLPVATSIARDCGSELIILHVMELPRAYAPGEWTFIPLEPDVEAIKQMLDKVKPTDPTVPYTHRMVPGDPATEIVRRRCGRGCGHDRHEHAWSHRLAPRAYGQCGGGSPPPSTVPSRYV